MHSFLRVVSCSLLPPFHHPQKRACVLVVDGGGLFFITITPLRGLYCPPLIPRIWWQSLLAQRQAKIGNSIPADSRWNAHQNWHSAGMPTGMPERNGNRNQLERNPVSFFCLLNLIIAYGQMSHPFSFLTITITKPNPPPHRGQMMTTKGWEGGRGVLGTPYIFLF